MKKNYLIFPLLLSALVFSGCNKASSNTEQKGESETGQKESEQKQESNKKLKEIVLRNSAPTSIRVTERITTSVFYDLVANKGVSLKTADKRVIVTSSNPEVLKVDKSEPTVTTFINALKPGPVKLTIQSSIQEELKLEIDLTVLDSAFDRQAPDGFFGNNWDHCDFTHESDEENPYIKTVAEDGVNHQFYFRDSYLDRFYVESEFTFISEQDGNAHMPKIGFVFSTNETNDTGLQSVSMIYLDTDCRGGKDTFYNIGYNEIANGSWGWDNGGGNPLAKCYTVYKHEAGIKVGETFKLGAVKEGYHYHLYLNGTYIKSIETTDQGFSVDKTLTKAAPTYAGLFDFKSEVKYSNYSFTTNEELINSKIPATPDYTNYLGE